MIRINILIAFLCLSSSLLSPNISVKSFRLLENDLDARVHHPKRDQNGEVCAIIKVVTTQTDFDWEPDALGIVAAERKTGEYWLYVPRGARRLTIKHDKLGILRNYQYPVAIQAATVYVMELITARVTTIVEEEIIPTQWLVITSEPDGADVYINDQPVGRTPYQNELPIDRYTWRISRELYLSDAGVVQITKDKREVLNVKLKPNFGTLNIATSPESGADITLNGITLGQKTPATLEKIPAGEHTISVRHDMYETTSQRVTLNAGQTLPVNISMKPTFAVVIVNTEPKSEIYINGERKGSGSWKGKLNPAVYTFEAKLDKHNTANQRHPIEAGKPLNLTLSPTPKTGELKVVTTPFDTNITLDGKDYGTTPTTVRDLLIGSYTLTLEKQGYGTVTKTITIAEGKTTDINETLPSGMEVTITSTPSGAQLWVGGVSVGTTPYKTTLAFSSHSVKLVNGKKEVNETINVTQGGKTRWEFDVAEFPPTGSFTDSRDRKTYKYVTIGKQVWMAENLAYKPSSGSYWAYDNNSSNVAKYGYLYDWQTAKNVCPTGWHLPSDAEWTQFTDFVGSNPGTKLKAKSGWSSNGNGTDDYGFSALPGGHRYSYGTFISIGDNGYWWSSTELNASSAWYRAMFYSSSFVSRLGSNKSWGFSVRCVRDF